MTRWRRQANGWTHAVGRGKLARMRRGRVAGVLVWLLVAVLNTSTALAQQAPDQPEFRFTPWAGVGLGLGGVRADCACGFDYGGGSFTGSISAGIDLSRSVSIG